MLLHFCPKYIEDIFLSIDYRCMQYQNGKNDALMNESRFHSNAPELLSEIHTQPMYNIYKKKILQ